MEGIWAVVIYKSLVKNEIFTIVYCARFSFSIISIEIKHYRIGNILLMEEIWINHFTGRLVPLSARGVMCTSEVFSCISSINSTKQNEQNKPQNCKIQLFTLLTAFNGVPVHDINEKTSHSWCCVFHTFMNQHHQKSMVFLECNNWGVTGRPDGALNGTDINSFLLLEGLPVGSRCYGMAGHRLMEKLWKHGWTWMN